MVYSNHFVVCVLVNGKPQKERKDGIVLVPYGAEYSLRFRNKHSRRAVVQFSIDGEDVSGPGYIVPANAAIDIHRHHVKDAKFKFVSIDSPEAVDHGKNDNSDGSKGVIEAKFFLEEEPKKPVEHHHHHHHYPKPTPYWPPLSNPWIPNDNTWNSSWESSGTMRMCGGGIPEKIQLTESLPPTIQCSFDPAHSLGSINFGDGCTVEGDVSGQRFSQQWINLESDFVLLRLTLKGVDAPVQVAVNEDYCTGCGAKRLRKADRFCGACGHRL